MNTIKIQTNKYFKNRLRNNYLWIFSNEIETQNVPKNISLAEIYDGPNFLGLGVFNPYSLISVRVLIKERKNIDKEFFKKLIINSLEYRKSLGINVECCRLIYGESDFMPGVVIDRYKDVFAIQFFSFAMEVIFKEVIIESLVELFKPKCIIIRNDFHQRELEKAPIEKQICYSKYNVVNEVKVQIDHLHAKFLVDVLNGQKTGFYYDQLGNRRYVYSIARDKKVLDLCCYTGSFSIMAALGSAKYVVGVDSSSEAISIAEENAKINKVKNVEFVKEEVEDFIKNTKNSYDLIIFDPPSYVKSKKDIKNAKKKYIYILSNIINLLAKDGILCFSVCARHIMLEDIKDIIKSSILKKTQKLFITYYGIQSLDHPIYMPMEKETEYLKFISLKF